MDRLFFHCFEIELEFRIVGFCGGKKYRKLTEYFFLFGFQSILYVWVIDQVWGQDGWILAKFFFCVFVDRDEVEVHINSQKKNEANIQPP